MLYDILTTLLWQIVCEVCLVFFFFYEKFALVKGTTIILSSQRKIVEEKIWNLDFLSFWKEIYNQHGSELNGIGWWLVSFFSIQTKWKFNFVAMTVVVECFRAYIHKTILEIYKYILKFLCFTFCNNMPVK